MVSVFLPPVTYLPIHTTTITVQRPAQQPDPNADPYDVPAVSTTSTVTALNVPAVITPPSANDALSGGTRVVYAAQLYCEACDIQAMDELTDRDGNQWTVLWARRVYVPNLAPGLTFDYMDGQLRYVTGAT